VFFFDKIDRSVIFDKLKNVNYNLLFIAILIFAFGIAGLYSTGGGNWQPWAEKQIIYFLIFIPIIFVIALININFWFKMSYLIYLGGLCSLILVEIIGHRSMGATRWINLGFMRVQPAEIMQICIILATTIRKLTWIL
jgi:rod shape determining protein RodA